MASIREDPDQNPVVKVEMTDTGEIVERTHDLVVLSQGIVPATDSGRIFPVASASDGFVSIPEPDAAPCVTETPGIFVTGTAMGPMDIVDSIVSASAVASEASAYLRQNGSGTRLAETDRQPMEAVHA